MIDGTLCICGENLKQADEFMGNKLEVSLPNKKVDVYGNDSRKIAGRIWSVTRNEYFIERYINGQVHDVLLPTFFI